MEQRFLFIQDEDCHWYLIPEHLKSEFDKLLYDEDNSGKECWERDEWNKFDGMRCNHPTNYTFVAPKPRE